MDIKEIIQRKSPATYTVEELQFAVETYIEQKKGQNVVVNIYKDMNMSQLTQFDMLRMDSQHVMLMNAFNIVQQNYTL